jgi:hypothetical protein
MTQPTRTEASTGLDRPLTPFVHPLPLPPRYQVTEPDPAHRACRGGTAPVPLRVGGEPDPAAVALLARLSRARQRPSSQSSLVGSQVRAE